MAKKLTDVRLRDESPLLRVGLDVSIDARVARTRKMLLDAGHRLASERPIHEIALLDIASLAGVSRQTTYQHYRDRDDLIGAAAVALLRSVIVGNQRLIDDRFTWLDSKKSAPMLLPVLGHMRSEGFFYDQVINSSGAGAARRALQGYFADSLRALLPRSTADGRRPPGQLSTFLAGGCMALIGEWLETAHPVTNTVLAHQISTILRSALQPWIELIE